MSTLILARHGRTSANAAGILAGRSAGVALDDTGRAQARAAAQRLDGLQLAAAFSSPRQRCRETAGLLLATTGMKARTDRGLDECDYGEWTGEKIAVLAERPLWRTVQAQPSAARFPGGESLPEMWTRAVTTVRRLDEEVTAAHGEHAVWLAVSHGDVIKAILADALGMHLDAFQRIVADPASLSIVRYTPHQTFVVAMNTREGSLDHLGHRPPAGKPSGAEIGGGAGPEPATS